MYETGSGSCPVVGFDISGVKPLGSATRSLIAKMDIKEVDCVVYETGSGSCLGSGFGISGNET
jgi:hypothetical protein